MNRLDVKKKESLVVKEWKSEREKESHLSFK